MKKSINIQNLTVGDYIRVNTAKGRKKAKVLSAPYKAPNVEEYSIRTDKGNFFEDSIGTLYPIREVVEKPLFGRFFARYPRIETSYFDELEEDLLYIRIRLSETKEFLYQRSFAEEDGTFLERENFRTPTKEELLALMPLLEETVEKRKEESLAWA